TDLHIEMIPFAATIGVELISAEAHEVRGSLAWAPERCTEAGTLHGGALMTLADTLGAACAYLNLPEGATTATVESKTNFFRPVRMTERDRAAVRVQLLAERIDPELPRHRQHLGRERLVQLDDVHVLDRHPRPLQHSPDGLDRPDAHDLRLDAGHGRGDDSRPRTDPELARPLLAHHDDRGRSVVQRARVARRHPAVGLERRLERRQSLQPRRRRPRMRRPHRP